MSAPQDVLRYLAQQSVQATVHAVADGGERAGSAAQALGVPRACIVKSLLFLADDEPVLLLVPGDRRVDVKKLKAHTNARRVKIADGERVKRETGFVPGAVPPVGHAQPLPTWIDQHLTQQEVVYTSAGALNQLLEIAVCDLVAASGAHVVDLAE